MRKCEKCGVEFEGKTCPNCGTELKEESPFMKSVQENQTQEYQPLADKPKTFWKNKLFIIPTIISILLLVTVVSLNGKINDIEKKSELYKQDKEKFSQKFSKISGQYDELKAEYNSYKEKMSPYEALDAAEAEVRKIEAERIAAEKKAAEDAAAAEAAAAKAAEEAAGYETGITYDQLARTPDEFKEKKVKFSGKVIQVLEGDTTVQIRLAVDGNYDTILFCEYISSIVSSRVLEDDYITIYGTSAGTISYDSTMGGKITIPGVSVDRIDQ